MIITDGCTLQLSKGAFLPLGWEEVRGGRYCSKEQRRKGYECTRARGHSGRHAHIGYLGTVFYVWGEDIHAAARAKGRKP